MELRNWTQPTLMIVGNHDQASPSGEVHSLTPFAAVSDNIHVFTSATKFLDALWLPYRSDHENLAAAIAEAGPVAAVFAHADVKDAFMNDLRRSTAGTHFQIPTS